MAETASRIALEHALLLYAPPDREPEARAFLEVLSLDELQFMAQFLGARILFSSSLYDSEDDGMDDDLNHKLILASEFAACCGFPVKFK